MSGGIIIQRRAVLLPAAMSPSIYNFYSDQVKDAVEAVNTKPPADVTEADIHTLAQAIASVCQC
jgi:hypothetical protein